MVRVEGIDETQMGGNTFDGKALLQNLLIGDLLPVQGPVLEATLTQGQAVRVRRQE